MGFVTDIFDCKELSFYAKGTYCLLSKFADKTGKCWPSLEKLQELSGLSRPTIIKSIKELSRLGHIEVEHRFNNGMKTSSLYTLKSPRNSDVNHVYHDVKDVYNSNANKANKSRCKGDLPRCKPDLLTDVNDIDINLSIINLSNNINSNDQKILDYLPTIKGYPFDSKKDIEQVREWLKNWPVDHILSELEKFHAWWRDKGDGIKKPNYRSRITNWLKNSKVDIKPNINKLARLDLD